MFGGKVSEQAGKLVNTLMRRHWEEKFNEDKRDYFPQVRSGSEGQIPVHVRFPKVRYLVKNKSGDVVKAQVWHTPTQQWMNLTDPNYGTKKWMEELKHPPKEAHIK